MLPNAVTVNQTFDRYIIEAKLGQGAMSTVFKALDTKLNRKVALKVLHPHLIEEGNWIQRFEVEAKTLASLSHPNVTQVYDFGVRDGNYFIVLELIEGSDFGGLLKKYSAIPWEIACVLFCQAGNGLQYIHEHGIVHRDIKLANILLQADGSVKMSDFGIAKSEQAQALTASDHVAGTPCYIAPELINGEKPSTSSDIFAFGVTLYYLISGKPPFFGKTIAAIFETIRQCQFPTFESMGILVPHEVDGIIRKCLVADTRKRYDSFKDIVKDLNACLVSGGVPNEKILVERFLREPAKIMGELRANETGPLLQKARALKEEGKIFEALRGYKHVLALDPQNTEAEEQLQTLQVVGESTETPLIPPAFLKERKRFRRKPLLIALSLCILLAVVIMVIHQKSNRVPTPPVPVAVPAPAPAPAVIPAADTVVPMIAPAAVFPAAVKKSVKPVRVQAETSVAVVKTEPPPAPAPAPDSVSTVPKVAEAPCTGKLVLYSSVWAYVFIDNEKKGVVPAKSPFEVPCGTHRVELRRPTGVSYASDIAVNSSEPAHLSVQEKDYR